MLSGDQYLAQANDNRVRNLRISAPRGTIVDRNSTPLVTSRQATVIQIRSAAEGCRTGHGVRGLVRRPP